MTNRLFIDNKNMPIRDLRETRRIEYNRWKPLRCPVMDDELVYFNKDGFFHLTHDGRRKIRGESDQRMRLNLLVYVRKVIYRSRIISADERVILADENKYGKNVHYYEIMYRFNSRKAVAVVLRRIGDGGRLHYYSVRYYNKSKY